MMMKKNIGLFLLLTFMLALFISACGSQESQENNDATSLIKTRVMLDWTPNTNHTGLYVALEKGFYQEEGLDVEILEAGDVGPDQLVAVGEVDFGVTYQENVTHARAADIPLVSLAAVIQHNTSGFASLKNDNLLRPRDLQGKRYGGWGSPAEHAIIEAIVTNDGGDPETIDFIDIGSTDFLSVIGKQVDFYWIFQGWDGIRAEQQNVPLNVIMLRDYESALDYYTPVIVTNEDNIAQKPDLVRKFMAATSKGYQYCMENPEESAEILLEAVPELDAQLVKASQKWLASQYQADAPYWGWQDRKVWENYANWMLEKQLLNKEIEAEKAFTNEFLPDNAQ
ncbi:MAG: ABC transporter substrate-binding protein [Peptococcia bacterium]|jgi:ABC-type nitrate/sulfonate/bicarbonate transport system substrate-binding protein